MYKKLSIAILIIITGLTAFFAYRTSQIGFDYNFETFFPKNDKDTDFFMEHRKRFGTDNDFVLIGLKNKQGIFNYSFLEKVQRLTDTLKHIPDVKAVISPVEIVELTRDPLMGVPTELPYLRWKQDSLYTIDSVRIYRTPELLGSLFSKDGKSVCIMVNHTERIDDDECTRLTHNLYNLAPLFQFDEYHVAGRCIGQTYYTSQMKGELIILLVSGFLAMVILMIIIYRSAIAVILPLIVVALVVVWTMGFMNITGKKIDMLANAIPTILVVTGLSVAVHIITKYIDHLREGWTKFDSLKDTVTHVGLANFFTTLTTVVGFASLATTGIKPIDDFGLYTAFGVALSFIIAYTVIPSLLYLLPVPKKTGYVGFPKLTWNNALITTFSFITRNKYWVLGGVVALVLSMVYGITRIRENTYIMDDLSKKSKLKKDFEFFGKEFQGTRPFEMSLTVKDTSKTVFDRDVLVEIEKMEAFLKNDYGLGYIFSPVSLVKAANRSYAGGDPEAYVIPESDARLRKIVKELKAFQGNDMIKAIISEDFRTARIRSIFQDVGSYKAHQMNLAFYDYMNTHVSKDLFEYKLIGTAELIDKNNRNLAWNIASGILISFVVVGIILAILFKSLIIVTIGIVTNVIPLILLGGIMGYFDINLKLSTAILFSIAFGIAVDDTIHFLSKFRQEILKEKTVLYALKRTYLTTGKAMIITSILLCTGFGVLGISSFQGTKIIGSLTALTLFFAMIFNLTILPVLILLFYRRKTIKTEVIPEKVA